MAPPSLYDLCACGQPKRVRAKTCRPCYVWSLTKPLPVFVCPLCTRRIVRCAGRVCQWCASQRTAAKHRAQKAEKANVGIFDHE